MRKTAWAGAALTLLGVLPAQIVWIVDEDQLPGTTHTDIPPAASRSSV